MLSFTKKYRNYIFIVLILLGGFLYNVHRAYKFTEYGKISIGSVYRIGKSSKSRIVYYKYKASGILYSGSASGFGKKYKIGKRYIVVYNKNNFADNIILSNFEVTDNKMDYKNMTLKELGITKFIIFIEYIL